MDTAFLWDESINDGGPFELTESELDCARIQSGDTFSVWTPNEKHDGGSTEYPLRVTRVDYHFDQTGGEPVDVTQYVFLIPNYDEKEPS